MDFRSIHTATAKLISSYQRGMMTRDELLWELRQINAEADVKRIMRSI